MQAKDVMTTTPITVQPDTSVRDVARRLLESQISAVFVTADDGQVVGIVSEGDLMRRPETGGKRNRSWWLALVNSPEDQAFEYIRTHGAQAKDVMTRNVLAVKEGTSLAEVAELLETHRIKRAPVLRDGKLVGIVSRADLLRGLVSTQLPSKPRDDDRAIKTAVMAELKKAGVRSEYLNLIVTDGVVDIWGQYYSSAEQKAASLAAVAVTSVKEVRNRATVMSDVVRTMMWAQ